MPGPPNEPLKMRFGVPIDGRLRNPRHDRAELWLAVEQSRHENFSAPQLLKEQWWDPLSRTTGYIKNLWDMLMLQSGFESERDGGVGSDPCAARVSL